MPNELPLIAWPGFPPNATSAMAALVGHLDESQWLASETLERLQFQQLSVLVNHALESVPYYRKRLAGCFPNGIGSLNHEAWRHLPLLTRGELQANYEALKSQAVPPVHGRVTTANTSGSTGMPVNVDWTALAHTFSGSLSLRGHRWHGRDTAGTLAMIHRERSGRSDFPTGHRQDTWGWPTSEIHTTGPAAVLDVSTPFAGQLEWLRRVAPDYLLTIPSNLVELLQVGSETNIKPPALRQVCTLGEVLDPELRQRCEKLWQVPVFDIYATREAGVIALQCPETRHYHVMAECVYVEVLDKDGSPCGPGKVGRIVVTPLHNCAMPLIRYQPGDYVEVGEPCACGRGLPVLKRILGRTRNMLCLPNGEKFWPSMGRREFNRIVAVKQHQFVQTELTTIEARLVVERPLSPAQEQQLRSLFLSRLPHPFDIRFVYTDEIPRGPGGKYEYYRCEVEA